MEITAGIGNDPSSQTENWKEIVLKYQRPSLVRGIWQLTNSVGGYVILWALMYWSLSVSLWLTAALTVLAGGFLVRIFIIFHDCGHGSFFHSRRANDVMGFLTGVLTFTPYALWRKEHALHHSTASDLDRRGTGDVPTMTVDEYLAASRWEKMGYRLVRNPVVLFGIIPLAMFLVKHRLPHSHQANQQEKRSVHWTNLTLLGLFAAMSFLFGFVPYLVLQIAVIGVAGGLGTWLFYVQHQFEGVYWEREEEWDFADAAFKGSSFYKLPKVLQWFSGNIGFHHIHHLSPRIANYNLERCHNAEPLFQTVTSITFLASLKCMTFRLWDERGRKLVGFRHLRTPEKP
ncbi:MAG: fatty acid desaturase [Verrucomicrobiota bacterium]